MPVAFFSSWTAHEIDGVMDGKLVERIRGTPQGAGRIAAGD
jgi:hypothetical protein